MSEAEWSPMCKHFSQYSQAGLNTFELECIAFLSYLTQFTMSGNIFWKSN